MALSVTERLDGEPALRLPGGVLMPVLGLGLWLVPAEEAAQVVRWGLEDGYRHLDTAAAYGNEEGVGRGLRESGVARERVFVTTKLRPGGGPARAQLEASLAALGLEHVDLYLIHSPARGAHRQWPELEELHEAGLARAIGVSNFGPELLRRTVAGARVPPMLNQVKFSPFARAGDALRVAEEAGVVLEGYSPLGHGRALRHPVVREVAERAGRTEAQVLVRWSLQRGVPTLPKSRNRERVRQNRRVFDFTLGPEDVARLDALGT